MQNVFQVPKHERKAILLLYLFFSFFVVVLNEISNVHNEQKCIDLIHGTGLLKMTGYLINQSRASSTCK